MSFDLLNFGGTVVATVIGAVIGVTGARMGERRRTRQEYESSVNAHVANIIGACATVAQDVARHDRAVTLLQQETAQRLSGFGVPGPSQYLDDVLTPVRMHTLLTVARAAMLSSAANDRRVLAQLIDVIEKLDAGASTAKYPDVLEKVADLLTRWRTSQVDENEAVLALRQLSVAGPSTAGQQPSQ